MRPSPPAEPAPSRGSPGGEVRPFFFERALYTLAFRAEKEAGARKVLERLVTVFLRAVAFERRRGGHRLFDLARFGAVRFGRWRAPILRERLGLNIDSMADMGRLQDWEDRVFGVTGHWTEQRDGAATKCETQCPFADVARTAPEICSDIVHALETATFQELNPSYRLLPLERLLSKGETCCEFRHEVGGEPGVGGGRAEVRG